jgi:hypothetical protein
MAVAYGLSLETPRAACPYEMKSLDHHSKGVNDFICYI